MSQPSQAANSRPDLKAAGSPIAATAAVALTTPTPGIAAIRRLAGLCRCHTSSRRSITPTSASSWVTRRPLLAQGFDHHRRQPLRDPREGRRHVPPHPRATARHHFAVFSQQTPQAVDLRGATLHQLLPHPMHRQNPLLRFALDRHRLDPGLLNRRHSPPRRCGDDRRPRYTPSTTRREAHARDTQARYARWQTAYRALKQRRPQMSDVCYARQIAKLAVAAGCHASTIRKHMTGRPGASTRRG